MSGNALKLYKKQVLASRLRHPKGGSKAICPKCLMEFRSEEDYRKHWHEQHQPMKTGR